MQPPYTACTQKGLNISAAYTPLPSLRSVHPVMQHIAALRHLVGPLEISLPPTDFSASHLLRRLVFKGHGMLDEATVKRMIGPTLEGMAQSEEYVPARSIVRFETNSIELMPSYKGAEKEMTIAVPRYAKAFVLHRFFFGIEGWVCIPERTIEFVSLINSGEIEELAAAGDLRDELRAGLAADIAYWRKTCAEAGATIREFRRWYRSLRCASPEE